MNSQRFFFCVSVCALNLFYAAGAQAQQSKAPEPDAPATAARPSLRAVPGPAVPHEIKFSAILVDSASKPLAGKLAVTFALYNQQQGGTPLWSETQNVDADSAGHYSVLLGAASSAGVSPELFTSSEGLWLGVHVQEPGEAEQPRVRWVSVPYALKAADAETVGGMPASAFVIAPSAVSGSNPTAGASGAAAALATTITGSGITGYIPEFTSSTAIGDSVLFQLSGNIGLGTTTPTAKLDVAGTVLATGTITTGGNLALPKTSSSSVGVLTVNGTPFLHSFGSNNTFVGASAGNLTLSGNQDTAVGTSALHANTTGVNNSAFGNSALQSNTGGLNNSAFGNTALQHNNTGNDDSAFGDGALFANTTGGFNAAFGVSALSANTTGINNSAFGALALSSNTASGNAAFGYKALSANTAGGGNSAFGDQALFANSTGADNAAFGTGALFSNSTGANNSAFGFNALSFNTASNNSAFGYDALQHNTSGVDNAAFGYNALLVNTTGSENDAFGFDALGANTTGQFNAAFGNNALNSNTTGANNSAFGTNALTFNTTGTYNSAFGLGALRSNTTSGSNSAFGYHALFANTGLLNSAFGYGALGANTFGGDNSAFGYNALFVNTTGTNNAAFGFAALASLTSGSGNTAIGSAAGFSLGIGSNNIYIGGDATGNASNTIVIGTQGTHKKTSIAGIYGATTSSTGTAVFVDAFGQLGISTSSRRFKNDIVDMGEESDLLMKLRPVSFYYKPELDQTQTRQYGLVAEEVAQVAPQLVIFDKDGTPETVRYHFVNAMLLNEVQKQRQLIEEHQRANEKQQQLVEKQQSTIARQQAEILDLAARLAKLEALVSPAP